MSRISKGGYIGPYINVLQVMNCGVANQRRLVERFCFSRQEKYPAHVTFNPNWSRTFWLVAKEGIACQPYINLPEDYLYGARCPMVLLGDVLFREIIQVSRLAEAKRF